MKKTTTYDIGTEMAANKFFTKLTKYSFILPIHTALGKDNQRKQQRTDKGLFSGRNRF